MTRTKALQREVVRKFRQVGLLGTLQHGVRRIFQDARTAVIPSKTPADPFDQIYGTDTSGVVLVGALDIPDDQMEHAMQYGAISEEEFDRLMKEIPVNPDGLAFIDLGSGKGRALLLASRYPFKRVIGVELSSILHEAAVRNIQLFRHPKQICSDVQSLCVDALNFEIPNDGLLIFMNHPFDDVVMHPVVAHIEASLRKHPRPAYIWYVKPEFRQVLDQSTFLHAVKETPRYVVYKSQIE